MKEPFFVMLHNQRDTKLLPLMDGEELAMFRTFLQAEEAAEANPLGAACGYEIFEAGYGIIAPSPAN